MKKVRNAVARLPIMKKGGVHDKTNKAQRSNQKQKLQKQIRTNNFGPYFFMRSLSLQNIRVTHLIFL